MPKPEIKYLVNKVLLKTSKFEDVFTKADDVFTTQRDIKLTLEEIRNSKRNSIKYPSEIRCKFKPKLYKVALISIFEMIESGRFKSDQEQLESLIDRNIFIPIVFFENRKSYTPCGVFYQKRNRLGIRILNQLLLFETKNNSINANDISVIKACEYTFAFYRQMLPNKYFLLVKTNKMNSRNYIDYQEEAEIHFVNLLGSNKLVTLELNTAIPFSYDAELYHNTQSKPFAK